MNLSEDELIAVIKGLFAAANETYLTCWCARCEDARFAVKMAATNDPHAVFGRSMCLCPDCGNKRCPKATWHGHACTGSNDLGQPGSDYR